MGLAGVSPLSWEMAAGEEGAAGCLYLPRAPLARPNNWLHFKKKKKKKRKKVMSVRSWGGGGLVERWCILSKGSSDA
jgi:hypothetical protein